MESLMIPGSPVWLAPALSLSLALALHELATNAAKYGAFSTDRGSVTAE
jgi:two-component system CheB/CheR fusion protein